MKVLIIEDETGIRESLDQLFQQAGFLTELAADGEQGWYYLSNYSFDIALIDLGLPKCDGVTLIKRLREQKSSLPVLILTARGHWADKVAGLNAGADDYVVKPFQPEEVLARVQALVRRTAGLASNCFAVDGFSFDFTTQTVTLNRSALEITGYEYKLLEQFVLHPGKVLSKAILIDCLYAQDFERDSNTIEVFVRRLRKKLDPHNQIKPIETLRGRGYVFKPERFTSAASA